MTATVFIILSGSGILNLAAMFMASVTGFAWGASEDDRLADLSLAITIILWVASIAVMAS